LLGFVHSLSLSPSAEVVYFFLDLLQNVKLALNKTKNKNKLSSLGNLLVFQQKTEIQDSFSWPFSRVICIFRYEKTYFYCIFVCFYFL